MELDGQFLSLDVLDTAGKVRIASFNLNRAVLSAWEICSSWAGKSDCNTKFTAYLKVRNQSEVVISI